MSAPIIGHCECNGEKHGCLGVVCVEMWKGGVGTLFSMILFVLFFLSPLIISKLFRSESKQYHQEPITSNVNKSKQRTREQEYGVWYSGAASGIPGIIEIPLGPSGLSYYPQFDDN